MGVVKIYAAKNSKVKDEFKVLQIEGYHKIQAIAYHYFKEVDTKNWRIIDLNHSLFHEW